MEDPIALGRVLDEVLAKYPDGAIVERYMPGIDVRVVCVEGLPALPPVETIIDPGYARRVDIFDYKLANVDTRFVERRAPARIPQAAHERLRDLTERTLSAFALRDVAVARFPRRASTARSGSSAPPPSRASSPAARSSPRPGRGGRLRRHGARRRPRAGGGARGPGGDARRDASRARAATPHQPARGPGLQHEADRLRTRATTARRSTTRRETIQAITAGHREPRPRGRPARGDARSSRGPAHVVERRRRLQHRRGDGRAQPRGAGAKPVRAARRPLHGERLGDAVASASTRRSPSGSSSTSTPPAFQVLVTGREKLRPLPLPGHRQAQPGGHQQGHLRRRACATTKAGCARWRASSSSATGSPRWSRSTSSGASSPWACSASGGRACCRPWRSCFSTQRAARVRLRMQAGLAAARALRVPREPHERRASRVERACRTTFMTLGCRDVARIDLRLTPRTGDLRHRGEPAARADARLQRPLPHRERREDRIPDAHRRDPERGPSSVGATARRGSCNRASHPLRRRRRRRT